MKKERRLFIYTIFVILLLCGCSEKRKTERKEGTTIQLSKAIEIDSLSLEERNNLLILSYSVPHCDTGSANLYSNGELVQNEQYGFYARGYYQDGAQYDYMTELYSINLETSEEKKIYYTDKAYLINEMTVNNKFLYWVEYITKEEKTYYIIREFNIETQKVKTIVEKSSVKSMELCPVASENYLAWYEEENGEISLMIYNILNGIISNIQGYEKARYTPYGRPYIVDGYIAFWVKKDNQVGICRYCIETCESDLFLLESNTTQTFKNCFCDANTIGWFTDYYTGEYYFYKISSGQLLYFKVDKSDDSARYVYSRMLKGQFYYFDSKTACLHIIDLDQMKETVQYLDKEQKNAFFILVNEQKVGIRTSNQRESQFYLVDI